jgi:4-amino-4-deoxy-L-arabinose transferase-like glycosyltransferase
MPPMNRVNALLIVFVLWAGIFLPGLGSAELKGEEGRRIMPAVTMLEGGSLVVPYVGGKPFLRKPPLVQWCMAGSMKLFGQNVWAARLPSALSVLALAIVLIIATQGWLITEESLVAAIVMMTQLATIDKCRLAELEAIYVALSGSAMVMWLGGWARGVSSWKLWTIPMICNALALLAKAPLHLLFFYAVVVGVLLKEKRLRELLHPAHGVGLLIMSAIIAAWAVPYFHEVAAGEAGKVWQRQFIERVTGAEMDVKRYLLNIPNGLANHLPWVLFAPLLWMRGVNDTQYPRGCSVLTGARNAVVICFIGLLLIPGVLPRYVQPLIAPFSLILAPALWNCPRRFRHWWRYVAFGLTFVLFLCALAGPFLVAAYSRGVGGTPEWLSGIGIFFVIATSLCLMALRRRLHESKHLAIWTALIAAMAMVVVAAIANPVIRERDDIRPVAKEIDVLLGGQRLYAYRTEDFAPMLALIFYLEETPVSYVQDAASAPSEPVHYLVRGKDRAKFLDKFFQIGKRIVDRDEKGLDSPNVIFAKPKVAAKSN